jgi:Zn-finger protein
VSTASHATPLCIEHLGQRCLVSLGLSGEADVSDNNIDEVDQADCRYHPCAHHVIGAECIVEFYKGEQAETQATCSVDADANDVASCLLVCWE